MPIFIVWVPRNGNWCYAGAYFLWLSIIPDFIVIPTIVSLVVMQYCPGVQSPVPLLTGPVQVDAATKGDERQSNPHSIQAQSNVNIHVILL